MYERIILYILTYFVSLQGADMEVDPEESTANYQIINELLKSKDFKPLSNINMNI